MSKLVLPPALAPGDTIGVVAPASNIEPEMLVAGIAHYDLKSFTKTLTRTLPAGPLDCRDTTILCPGKARGPLLGGCLPLIVALIGTRWDLATEGSILFLEDTMAKPYQIDRMLMQ